LLVEKTCDANDRIQLKQRHCCRRRIKIYVSSFEGVDQRGGKFFDVHLKPDGQRCLGTNTQPDAAV
jgi:hypothetical protein